MISVDNVTKDYTVGKTVVQALKGVAISMDKGEFVSIAGPSGSGKTTLLNLIGCLDTATTGSISISGEAVSGKSKNELALLRRRRLGFVFQSFNLIPVFTVFENISFGLELLTSDRKVIYEKTMAVIKAVGLEGLDRRFPNELSGGQQQRVAIARALVKGPDIVLADEPTANLDSATGKDILQLMERLNSDLGTTFVFSTHDRMVMDLAHRLVMIHDGLITGDEKRR